MNQTGLSRLALLVPQLHSDNTTKGNYVWVKLALIF